VGGRVFGLDLPRISSETALRIIEKVRGTGFPFEMIPWLPSKTDHGDIDLVMPKVDLWPLGPLLQAKQVKRNGQVWSFLLPEDIQLDIITNNNPRHAVAYLTYDVGMFLGQVAIYQGLTFALEGLRLRADPALPWSEDILLETDPVRSFRELGYEFPFPPLQNEEELFQYILSSALARPDIFRPENLNAHNRTRNSHRPAYVRFVQQLKCTGVRYLKRTHRETLDAYPQLQEQAEAQRTEWQRQKDDNYLLGLGAVFYWQPKLDQKASGEIVRKMQLKLPTKAERQAAMRGAPDVRAAMINRARTIAKDILDEN